MKRNALITLLKSVIFPNTENKIDASKHQSLEEQLIHSVLVKDEEIIERKQDATSNNVFSANYINTDFTRDLTQIIRLAYKSDTNPSIGIPDFGDTAVIGSFWLNTLSFELYKWNEFEFEFVENGSLNKFYIFEDKVYNYGNDIILSSGSGGGGLTEQEVIDAISNYLNTVKDSDNNYINVTNQQNAGGNCTDLADAIANVHANYWKRGKVITFYNNATSKWEAYQYQGADLDNANWTNTANWVQLPSRSEIEIMKKQIKLAL